MNRRTVLSTLAALPVLAAPAALLGKSTQSGVVTTDPLGGQIKADLDRILEELRANPRRPDTARTLESTLRFHAAWIRSRGTDSAVTQRLRRAISSKGKQAVIDEALVHAEPAALEARRRIGRNPSSTIDVPLDGFDAALSRLQREGLSPTLIAAADHIRKVAEYLAAQPQGVPAVRLIASRDFYGLCEDARRQARHIYYAATAVCAIAIGFPALWPECYAAWLYWAFADDYAHSVCGGNPDL